MVDSVSELEQADGSRAVVLLNRDSKEARLTQLEARLDAAINRTKKRIASGVAAAEQERLRIKLMRQEEHRSNVIRAIRRMYR